ncbi:uncharacterized protein LOC135209542 [Macrobrachium nipponense]|uniref:uncharacterized protein LOC135209542 n=1 Tax=Macrobrachium nipponense TaxID=159736 RepID=UPI0030C7B87D
MTEISLHQESPLNLPQHNNVWIALWNKNKFDFKVHFYLCHSRTTKCEVHHPTVTEGWSIMSISTDIVFYGNKFHKRWVTPLKGCDFRILTNYQLHLQVFPMPLEPQETSKLPAITTGMYTETTTNKTQVPPTGTSTGSSPVKPEDSPTGIRVSTQTIIGVVVAALRLSFATGVASGTKTTQEMKTLHLWTDCHTSIGFH